MWSAATNAFRRNLVGGCSRTSRSGMVSGRGRVLASKVSVSSVRLCAKVRFPLDCLSPAPFEVSRECRYDDTLSQTCTELIHVT